MVRHKPSDLCVFHTISYLSPYASLRNMCPPHAPVNRAFPDLNGDTEVASIAASPPLLGCVALPYSLSTMTPLKYLELVGAAGDLPT